MAQKIKNIDGEEYTFRQFREYALDKNHWRMFKHFPHDDIKISEETINELDKLYTDYLRANFDLIYRIQKNGVDV